jgi:hypothetical protein
VPDSNAGGVLDGDFGNDGTGEWPLAAAGAGGADQQQEAGRLSLPGSSVPIFEGITYETADGQPWKPSARQQAAAAAKKQQQVRFWARAGLRVSNTESLLVCYVRA